MKNSIITLVFFISVSVSAQVPDWFVTTLEGSVGSWVADNSAYQSEQEPFDQYGMDWEWGVGKQSIKGTLYGLINGQKKGTFWEFRQYWDHANNHGVLVQYAPNGTMGSGPMVLENNGETKLVQDFVSPNGKVTKHGHRSTLENGTLVTTSFDIDEAGNWTKRRSYTWKLQLSKKSLGALSMSLAVKDIAASKEFYEKLGYQVVDGKMEQNWLILSDGESKLGLFQGMFPANTLTYNPENIRAFYKMLEGKGIKGRMARGMDQETGPASFMITDPDGNPILMDQH